MEVLFIAILPINLTCLKLYCPDILYLILCVLLTQTIFCIFISVEYSRVLNISLVSFHWLADCILLVPVLGAGQLACAWRMRACMRVSV